MLRCALLLLFTMALTGAARAADAPRPNIIYILLDDAGWGDLSCYGQQKFTTPNMDRLATEGMKFSDHYSGSTVCAPTRCSLMTGKHTGHCYVRANREVQPEGQAPMPADIVTIPRLLHKAGYTTGMFGKWGLGAPGSTSDPVEHFDVFYGYNCQREAHNYYPSHLWANRNKVLLDGKTYAHDLIMEQALQFVRDNQRGPFFAYLSVTIPHASMHAPEADMKPWRQRFSAFEGVIGKYAGPQVRNPIAAFAAMMTHMDRNVGELMALLKTLDIDDNTIVLLTSDNGPHLEGGHDPKFFDSNGPFRGFKRDLYEGGIRAPLLVRWPGHVKAGSTSDLPSAHWDMLPTFCALAGVTPPADLDGISILPTLLDKADEQTRHDYLYWEFAPRGGGQAVRMDRWKAVRLGLQKDADAPIELYDLRTDIGEEHDVAKDHADVVAKMRSIMTAAHTPSETFKLIEGE
ncbi:MAG: sulfatase-like hydrolase/transferase [Phycisphaera sp.]|nr:sulfatase-like hydrolase/transferase [Phycisphaera sp.]